MQTKKSSVGRHFGIRCTRIQLIYPGLYLQNEGKGKNVCCIHVHVKYIGVSCLMFEVNNYDLKWR